MLSVTSIESCFDCGEYRNLVLCVDYRILCCAETIESCIVCDEYRIWLCELSIETRFACDEYRNLVLSVANTEILVLSVVSIEIL